MILRYGCGYGYGPSFGYAGCLLLTTALYVLFTTGLSITICHPKGECDAIVRDTIRHVRSSFPQYRADCTCFRNEVDKKFAENGVCVRERDIMAAMITCVKRRISNSHGTYMGNYARQTVKNVMNIGLDELVRQNSPEGTLGDGRVCKDCSVCCVFKNNAGPNLNINQCLRDNCNAQYIPYWNYQCRCCRRPTPQNCQL